MPDDVTNWLQGLGLGQYAKAFEENDVDWDVLSELDHESLKDLGVDSTGHRLRILKSLKSITNVESSATTASESSDASTDVTTNIANWERYPDERKPATILFADIAGSTAITEHLDAEDAHNLLDGARSRMCSAIEKNRGTVCRVMGDGVMAVFGAPVASEHHAVDACEAAMQMQCAISDYGDDIAKKHGSRLRIRVGLHSGEIVVLAGRQGDKVEYDADGPTVPIAARMEQSAQPGNVYLTGATQRLASHRIVSEALEPISVKGISRPVAVFALKQVRTAEEGLLEGHRTAFVGRRAELTQFRGMVEACIEESAGQTVYVRGEPGIGKTRLVGEFARVARERGASVHRGLALPFGVGKGQDAIRSLVKGLLGIPVGSDKDMRQRAADSALSDGHLDPGQMVFINDLLDLDQPMELRALYDAMDNRTRNWGKQSVVSRLVEAASIDNFSCIIVEDAQWADPQTLAHLSVLTKTVANCCALLVITSRIEGEQLDQRWRGTTDGSPFVSIDLGPLRKKDSMALISEFMDKTDPLAQSYLERAAGNPLFLEQLLRHAQEGTSVSLPDSVRSLVLARMDRLEPKDKKSLQAASVLGQRFDAQVLKYLLDDDDYNCEALVEHNLVKPEATGYLFAHALIQEGIYGSLLKSQQQGLHERAADWFAKRDIILYAEHLGRAGAPEAAAAYFAAACDQASQFRYETSLRLIEKGLRVDPNHSTRHDLICLKGEVLQDLGDVDASMAAYQTVVDQAHADTQRCDGLLGLAAGMRLSTNYTGGLDLLVRAEPIAIRDGVSARLARLHFLRGNLYFSLGRTNECRNEHGMALESARAAESIEDEVQALGGIGDAEYACGRMRTARDYLRECVEKCAEHGFGRVEVANRAQLAVAIYYCGEWHEAQREFKRAIRAAVQVGHQRAEMNARTGICFGLIEAGDWAAVEANARRGLELAKQLGARAWEPILLSNLAHTLLASGNRTEATQILVDAERIQEEMDCSASTAGHVYGGLVQAADDAETREAMFAKGEAVVNGNSLAHVAFRLYWSAIDGFVDAANWGMVQRVADALGRVTRDEPLGWSEFYIRRARILAAIGRGLYDAQTLQELRTMCVEAEAAGRIKAVPALKRAVP